MFHDQEMERLFLADLVKPDEVGGWLRTARTWVRRGNTLPGGIIRLLAAGKTLTATRGEGVVSSLQEVNAAHPAAPRR